MIPRVFWQLKENKMLNFQTSLAAEELESSVMCRTGGLIRLLDESAGEIMINDIMK